MLGISEVLRSEHFVNNAVQFAVGRNPALQDFAEERVWGLARTAASEMAAFEEIARNNPLRTPKTPEQARRIVAIWDVSAMGTYLKEFQDDRWKNTPWAAWTDRRRLNYSATLIRKLTAVITGQSYKTSIGVRPGSREIAQLRADIENFGPHLIYGSTFEQNNDLREVLNVSGVALPKSKAYIIDDPLKTEGVNTVDQMKSFTLPPNLHIQDGDVLVIVAHAPHMMRTLHLANRYKPFPENLIIQPHPIPSPLLAGTDYATSEISGTLYYTFITRDSSEQIHPYEL